MPGFSTYLQKVRSKKTNEKQLKILEKGKYVTLVQIAFLGIADGWTMNYDEYLHLIERSRRRHTNVAW